MLPGKSCTGRPLSARHLTFGYELRRYRKAFGLSLDEAARFFELSESRLSGLENGRCIISRAGLLLILDEYGASREAQQTLATLVADQSVWWKKYVSSLPGAYIDLAAFLTCAVKVTVYESQQIPLLLQTGAYSQVLAAADRALDDRASIVIPEMVKTLQREVVESGGAALRFVVGETALRNYIGDDDVMRDQLARLSASSEMSDLRVLPLGSAPNPAFWTSSMTLVEFPEEAGSVVHLGGPGGGMFLVDEDDVAPCARLLAELSMPEGVPA